MRSQILCFFLLGIGLVSGLIFAQDTLAPPKLPPDERFKADILVFTAHPDDQIQISGYLARAIYDEHRRVAVVFGDRGNEGSNLNGYEQASALAQVEDIEARRAVAAMGIVNVWFLSGTDTVGQDLLRSLETWHRGNVLEQAVRYIRLTRPEVILTMLPGYVAGENHGDHQALGTIATEAFDLAGDATAFPEQLAAPPDRLQFANLTEGLSPWQPKKLYFFTDASHTDFLEGKGPKYSATEISPSRHVPYCQFMAEQLSFYLTQFSGYQPGDKAYQALARGDFRSLPELDREWLFPWTYFIFGKSLVQASTTGDIFEGITTERVPFARPRGYQSPARQGLSLEWGGPLAFYHDFWPAHNIEHLGEWLAPEVEVHAGEPMHVPLVIHNDSALPEEVTVHVELPAGWTEEAGSARYPVSAHDTYPIEALVHSYAHPTTEWTLVRWQAEAHGKVIGSVSMRVKLSGVNWGLPQ
jgi:LmbE family N-acetylglucosaminyl deacetylase